MTTAAYLHRYASVVAFLALPVGGWLLARRPARQPAGPPGRYGPSPCSAWSLAAAMIWSAYPGDRLLSAWSERLLIDSPRSPSWPRVRGTPRSGGVTPARAA